MFIWRFNIILYVAQVRIYGLRSTDNHLTTYVVIEGNVDSRTILPPLPIYCHTFFSVYDIHFTCLLFVIIFSTTIHTNLKFPLHLKYYIWSSLLHLFHVSKWNNITSTFIVLFRNMHWCCNYPKFSMLLWVSVKPCILNVWLS